MNRALREFRIRGVATNLTFLEAIITHPNFRDNSYTTRFIDTTPELFAQVKRQDRATKLLNYLADVTRQRPSRRRAAGRSPNADAAAPVVPYLNGAIADGTKQLLDELGPKKFADWMRGAEAGAGHRHDDARRPPVAAGDAHAHLRHRPHRRHLCARAAATVLARMLGRRDLRRRHALPDRGPVGAAGAGARGGAQPPAADAAARRQRRRLHQLSRQCRAAFRQPGGRGRHRPVPRLRLPQLGREHARLDGCGGRGGQALRSGDLLHRRHPRSGPRQIRPQILCRAGQGAGSGRRAYHRRQGHGGAAEAGGGARAVQGAARGDRPADPFPHARHVGPVGGDGAGGGRKRRRCDRCGDGCASPATPRSPASARSSRR